MTDIGGEKVPLRFSAGVLQVILVSLGSKLRLELHQPFPDLEQPDALVDDNKLLLTNCYLFSTVAVTWSQTSSHGALKKE